MSDDLPTDQEVRERFIDGFPIDTWAVARDDERKRFDQWLNERLAQAWSRGWDAGHLDASAGPLEEWSENPYRPEGTGL